MDESRLIGMRVMRKSDKAKGIVESISNGFVIVNFHGSRLRYAYPAAFNTILITEDSSIRGELWEAGNDDDFSRFKERYKNAVEKEISILKKDGGREYHATDGVKLQSPDNENLYTFDTDTEFSFPDGTLIKIVNFDFPKEGSVVSCDEYTITIRVEESLGQNVEKIDFTANQWQLLESLDKRLNEMNQEDQPIAYEIACEGRSKIERYANITYGQDAAFQHTLDNTVTFIWGPPGTGKTYTLATIALDFIRRGKRVLMLSYSNVSVDGALLKVAERANYKPGQILRYGYPKIEQLRDNDKLASYRFVLQKYPNLKSEYDSLIEERKKTSKKSERRLELSKRIKEIRESLLEKEKEVIQSATFLATTVSKAIADKAVYSQEFDLVIFDEASMAYVPQVVFAAGLAKSKFVCLGDFKQLPAIVEGKGDDLLENDIFWHTSITEAVESGCGHQWLVMLNEQHRMHPDISDFVSAVMYNNQLKTAPESEEENKQIADDAPFEGQSIGLLDLSGMYSVCVKTEDGSRVNVLSAMISVLLAKSLCEKYEVGIITPYKAQANFITNMLRDLKEEDPKFENITSATVHQFQGSEKPFIIYDTVDCYRMKSIGSLLSKQKNDIANRLFNVAMTRAKGKFLLITNKNYMIQKGLSPNLMLTKMMDLADENNTCIQGEDLLKELDMEKLDEQGSYFSDRKHSWETFLNDLTLADEEVRIELPGAVAMEDKSVSDFSEALQMLNEKGVSVVVRKDKNSHFPDFIENLAEIGSYVTNPVTIIDKEIIWFGQPLTSANFISEGKVLKTEYFPCVRFCGQHTAKALEAILNA